MIIVDTNVISELMKSTPHINVRDWLHAHRGPRLYTTAVTVAEIRYGIERLPPSRRKSVLAAMADEIFTRFSDKVLSLTKRQLSDIRQL